MDAKERINSILSFEGITAAKLAEDIGDKRPQAIYDILNGKTREISKRMATKIKESKRIYNIDWLLTGEGPMLESGSQAPETKQPAPDMMSILGKLTESVDRLTKINERKDTELQSLNRKLEHLQRCIERLLEHHDGIPFEKEGAI